MELPIKLSQLTGSIRTAIEDAFYQKSFWVIADVTNHSHKADKNYHNFDLVEKDSHSNTIIAKISGKAWSTGAFRIAEFEAHTGQKFTNGLQVLVLVSIEYHLQYGISVSLLNIDANFTLGQLEQQRNATLKQLAERNDFIRQVNDRYVTFNNGLQLKQVIQRIALISSSVSAGGEDFKHTLAHNGFGYTFIVDDYFATVQGERNIQQFLDRLYDIHNSGIPYDAVVITRGGGAQTDFLIFDNYRIARAVAKFPIPILTGIGHRKNETITDLMAHTQTKTPTKAAELIIAHNRIFEEKLLSMQKDIIIKSQQIVANSHQKLSALNNLVINNSKAIINRQRSRLHSTAAILVSKPQLLINNWNNEIKNSNEALKIATKQFLKNQNKDLEHYAATIEAMAPENILKKGYAIIQKGNTIITDPEHIAVGDDINIILSGVNITSTVKQKSTNGE